MPDKNPKLDDPEFKRRVAEDVENFKLFRRFQQVALDSLDALGDRARSLPKDQQPSMGDAEIAVIRNLQGVGVKEGLLATVGAFVLMRRGPVWLARVLKQRQAQKQSGNPFGGNGNNAQTGYKLSNPDKPVNPFDPSGGAPSPSQTLSTLRSRHPFVSAVWFVIDVFLSLGVGASVSMYFTDLHTVREEMLSIPLLPGKSLVSDTFCDPVEKEWNKMEREKNPALARLKEHAASKPNPVMDSPYPVNQMPPEYYFDTIQQFMINCQRRRYAEKQLREFDSSNGQIEIPSPGVDRFGPRLALEEGDVDDEKSDDNDTGDSDSQWWLVNDQGQDDGISSEKTWK